MSDQTKLCALSHISLSVECHSSVVVSTCDAGQNRLGTMPSRAELVTATLPQSSLQGTGIDSQSALTLFLGRMDKMESNIANVTKTNNHFYERITAQEQDKVSLHPHLSEYQGDDLREGDELRPVNTEIDLTIREVVRDQAEAMFTGKYSFVAGLFTQNSPVPKTSGHLPSHYLSQGVKAAYSTSFKRKLDDENDLNMGN